MSKIPLSNALVRSLAVCRSQTHSSPVHVKISDFVVFPRKDTGSGRLAVYVERQAGHLLVVTDNTTSHWMAQSVAQNSREVTHGIRRL